MELLFLGTGAADWPIPPQDAEERRNAAALLDGVLLLDAGPGVPEALRTYGAAPERIAHVLITHSHGDHFCPETLLFLAGYGPVEVYGHGDYAWKVPADPRLRFHPIAPFQEFRLGDTVVTALPSTHLVEDSTETPLHYILERDRKRIFYSGDGAWLLPSAWERLNKGRYDLCTFDATFDAAGSHILFYHNSADMVIDLKNAFAAAGLIDGRSILLANHLSRRHFPSEAAARARFAPAGITPARDGLRVEL